METFTLYINDQEHEVQAENDTPLLWVLRDNLGLTGTKYSCGRGLCGSCTVHVDGNAVQSCSTPVSSVGDKQVTTIEGLAPQGGHPLQEAWLDIDVSQCGYCQPGQIMTAAALLKSNPDPSDEEIHAAMKDILCRCGTYLRIRNAIHLVVSGGAS
jgi:aerobic-type carbon monoxide dehydrogenase small subunit (CoxS/CutS family)